MRITGVYSHFNGLEYALVREGELYSELVNAISVIPEPKSLSRTGCGGGVKARREEDELGYLNAYLLRVVRQHDWVASDRSMEVGRDTRYAGCASQGHSGEDCARGATSAVPGQWVSEPSLPTGLPLVKGQLAFQAYFGRRETFVFALFANTMALYAAGIVNAGIAALPSLSSPSLCRHSKHVQDCFVRYERVVERLRSRGANVPSVPLVIIGIEP